MTIAIGLLARGGIVLASDSQETAGPFKGDVRKIEELTVWEKVPRLCATSGAGYSPYIDRASEAIRDLFEEHSDNDPKSWQAAVEGCLRQFYEHHYIPFRDPSLDIALLIATYQKNGRGQLLVTDKSTAREEVWFTAIGIGQSTAMALLEEIHSSAAPLHSAAITAAYVIWKIKQQIADCGQSTDITIVTRRFSIRVARSVSEQLEPMFRKADQLSTRVLRSALDPALASPDVPGALAYLQNEIRALSSKVSSHLEQLLEDGG